MTIKLKFALAYSLALTLLLYLFSAVSFAQDEPKESEGSKKFRAIVPGVIKAFQEKGFDVRDINLSESDFGNGQKELSYIRFRFENNSLSIRDWDFYMERLKTTDEAKNGYDSEKGMFFTSFPDKVNKVRESKHDDNFDVSIGKYKSSVKDADILEERKTAAGMFFASGNANAGYNEYPNKARPDKSWVYGYYKFKGFSGELAYNFIFETRRGWESDGGEAAAKTAVVDIKKYLVPDKSAVGDIQDNDFPNLRTGLDICEAISELIEGAPSEKDKGLFLYKLDVKASPDRPSADGKTIVKFILSVTEQPADKSTEPKPFKGAAIIFAETASNGKIYGSLDPDNKYGVKDGALNCVTGDNGNVEISYLVPSAIEAKEIKDGRVEFTASCKDIDSNETIYITFQKDNAKVFAEPHYDKLFSNTAIIPADNRFPATIELYLENDDLTPKKGAKASFSISGTSQAGILETKEGVKGISVETITDDKGIASVLYRYTGPAILKTPVIDEISISSPDLKTPLKAHVSAGIDLAIKKVEHRIKPGQQVSMGDEVPLYISVYDAFHKDVSDISAVLSHWSAGDNPIKLGIKLDIVPAGVMPTTLFEDLAQGKRENASFHEIVSLKFADETNEDVIFMYPNSAYAGWPRLKPMFTGSNYYYIKASLATGETGTDLMPTAEELPEMWRTNNRWVINIPTGLPANAFIIYALEDPFGPHTKEAIFFRQVLSLMGGDKILDVSAIASKVQQGNFEDIGDMIFDSAKDAILEKIKAKKIQKADDLIELYEKASEIEDSITGFYESRDDLTGLQNQVIAPLSETREEFMSKINGAIRKKYQELLSVQGNTDQLKT